MAFSDEDMKASAEEEPKEGQSEADDSGIKRTRRSSA